MNPCTYTFTSCPGIKCSGNDPQHFSWSSTLLLWVREGLIFFNDICHQVPDHWPPLPPLIGLIPVHFFTPLFSFAIESYLYETDSHLVPVKNIISPPIIGSKLTTTSIFSYIHGHLNYYMYMLYTYSSSGDHYII